MRMVRCATKVRRPVNIFERHGLFSLSDVIINKKPDTDLSTHDFYYDLPEELIAQHPTEVRDASRLMVIDRATGAIEHRHFHDITDYLRPTDTLVINDSRVIPARLYGHASH